MCLRKVGMQNINKQRFSRVIKFSNSMFGEYNVFDPTCFYLLEIKLTKSKWVDFLPSQFSTYS